MKFSLGRRLALMAAMGLGVAGLGEGALAGPPRGGIATQFGQREVNPNNFIVVASPYGDNAHQLLILEQLSQARPCWQEQGNNPVRVEPLLVQFDFTGICGRSSDSNGYSLRVGGQDLGWRYSLRVVKREGELRLVGISTVNRQLPELQIGRANGITTSFAKIVLDPGWRLTKRVYQGKALGHIYLTHDRPLATLENTGENADTPPAQGAPPSRSQPSPASNGRSPTPSLLTTLRGNRQSRSGIDRQSGADYEWTAESSNASASRRRSAQTVADPSRYFLPPHQKTVETAESNHLSPFSGRRPQTNRRSSRTGQRQGAPRRAITRRPNPAQSEVVIPIAVPPPETRAVRTPRRLPPSPPAGRSSTPLPPPPPAFGKSVPNLLPVPRASIPLGNGSAPIPANTRRSRRANSPPPPPSSLASALGYNYRLIVQARNPRLQNKVRAIVPDAFRTRWNGREAMQAGLFVDRAEAEALRQLLSSQGLQAKIFPVR